MNGQPFYFCTACGANLAGMDKHFGAPMCCCHDMELLQSNPREFPAEHGIHVAVSNNKIQVHISSPAGDVHPMADDHRIEWIYLHTQERGQRKMLWPGKRPQAVFRIKREEPAILYAYCSKHGLWEKPLPVLST